MLQNDLVMAAAVGYGSLMSIWSRFEEFINSLGASACLGDFVAALRSLFGRDADLNRRVAFSVAIIALSAKMAKADGVVTQDEIRAFHEIFVIPTSEARNVARLYDLAKRDVAGFEAYAEKVARLCEDDPAGRAVLEDVMDGLFHVAKADGLLHQYEDLYLKKIAQIFALSQTQYEVILARHLDLGERDPYNVLGVNRSSSWQEIKRRYRSLVAEHHPDKLTARGLPLEFIAIATERLAAINAAFDTIERGFRTA